MKNVLFTVATLAAAAGSASAFAEGPRASSSNAIFTTAERQLSGSQLATPQYQWQYHYVGHHPRLEGYWALVR